MAKTADFRHIIRFIIVLEHYPQKTAQTHGQKQLKKGEKKCFTHFIHTANNTQKKPQISEGYMFLKKALTSAGNYSRIALLFGHSSVGRTTDC